MVISIIIPNYNGEKLLKRNLPKVFGALKDSKYNVEIIVVDDGSTDGSVQEFKIQNSKFKNTNKKIKIIKNPKNLGFSSTVNKGVKESKGDVVVLLNTDAYPEKDFLVPLIQHFEDPNLFAVGCLDKSIENGKIVSRGRGIGHWEKGFLVHSRGEIDKTNTLWASGGSSAFRKSIWDKLSGLDEIYSPFYWEDIDLSYRALKAGYKILFEPKSIIYHEHRKGSIKTNYKEFEIKSIAYRNQFIFAWKNGTDFSVQFSQVFFLPYHLILALKNKDWAFFVGFIRAFVLLPKIIQSSFKDQKFFIKSDKEIVAEFKK